jgi:hypothetical protein
MTDDTELVEGVRSTDVTADDGAGDDGWSRETMVSTLPIVDRLETEAGLVVMVASGAAHRIVRLSQLGAEILDAVGEDTTLGALEAEMLARLGPPPDGDLTAAVHEAVRGLADSGLLSIS